MSVLALLLIALVAVIVGVACLNLAFIQLLRREGFRPSRKPPRVAAPHAFSPSLSQTLRGGERVGWWGTKFPTATIVVDDRWAFVNGFEPVWVDRETVTSVRRIRTPFANGVLFDSPDGIYDGVIFWPTGTPEVLAAFERFGWPVTA